MTLGLHTSFDVTCRLYGLASALTWSEDWAVARRSGLGFWAAGEAVALSAVAAGLTALLVPFEIARAVAVVLLAAAALAAALRGRVGRDASDDMQTIIGVCLAAALLSPSDSGGRSTALTAIAAQMGVCYLVSAMAKAGGRGWRNGSALADVLATEAFGLGRQLRARDGLLAVAGWTVVLVELLLPVAFLIGGPLVGAAVAIGLCLHLGIAVTMGLSRFLITWTCGYVPLVWWACHHALLA